jgi:hypothetical protein
VREERKGGGRGYLAGLVGGLYANRAMAKDWWIGIKGEVRILKKASTSMVRKGRGRGRDERE